jgi:hypothetical protein
MLAIALAIVASTSAVAEARDVCMTFEGGGSWVVKRFRIPARNKCETVHGFDRGSPGMITGTACTDADGSRMSMSYTASSGFYFESGLCQVKVPMTPTGTTGRCWGQYLAWPPAHDRFAQDVTLTSCDVDVPY